MKTQEIRWFFEQPQAPLVSFFEGLPTQAQTLEQRTDKYLVSLLSDELGVKLREDRLEIKYRVGRPEIDQIAHGMEGFNEIWVKHGFQLKSAESYGLPHGNDPEWLVVEKIRRVTLVDATDVNLHFHPLGSYSPNSIQMEYTRISISNHQWYTFGLEWLEGNSPGVPESFFAGMFQGTLLKSQHSMGYPAFLKQLVGKTA